jgi:hypothetical protein
MQCRRRCGGVAEVLLDRLGISVGGAHEGGEDPEGVAEVLLDCVGVGGAHEGDELRQVDAARRAISGRRRPRRRGRRRAALRWRWRSGEDEPARKLLLLPAVGEDAAQAEMRQAEL